MANIIEITVQEFLEKYARGSVYDVVSLKVGTQQRVYGRTREFPADGSGLIVYCVV